MVEAIPRLELEPNPSPKEEAKGFFRTLTKEWPPRITLMSLRC